VFSKKYIVKAKDANTFKQEFFRLKHNKEIFDTILAQQKQIVLPSENIGIVIGSNDAEYKIIMVSNPSCIACQTAHNSIKGLLCDHKNLKVQILFTINDDVHSNRNHFIRYIMALYEFDPEKALFALDEWYNSRMKNQQEIERKFPLENDKYNAEKLLEMDKWCKDAKISATPTFFIHGHQLPTVYNISDLSYLIT
jgi:protein-disulfide isomerase